MSDLTVILMLLLGVSFATGYFSGAVGLLLLSVCYSALLLWIGNSILPGRSPEAITFLLCILGIFAANFFVFIILYILKKLPSKRQASVNADQDSPKSIEHVEDLEEQ